MNVSTTSLFLRPTKTDLQAMDRAHRIGQKKTVYVYKLVTNDSIEEKIMKIQESKMDLGHKD